jgi:8-amino-7-oxononanoate synthase
MNPLWQRWDRRLGELEAQGRLRELSPPAGVDFSSNDYLGYGSGRRAVFAHDAKRDLGRSGMASRLLRGNHPIWEQVENLLGEWQEFETALVMPSGYAANLAMLTTLTEPGDWVLSDELNHASLIDGLRLARTHKLIYRHNDLNHLEECLKSAARQRFRSRELFIVTETLFSMDGDLCPLRQITKLAQKYEANLLLDEAHATGCLGKKGAGYLGEEEQEGYALAAMHTGGKALGVPGAFIACCTDIKRLFVNCSRQFICTTALPPAIAWWWLDAVERVKADDAGRETLHDNAAFFRAELTRHDIPALGSHYIVPVVLGADAQAVQAAQELRTAGWDIRAIRPPTVPEGTARLRISIHADHDRETLQRAAAAVAAAVKRALVPAP